MPRFLCAISLIVVLAAFDAGCRKKHVAAPLPPPPKPALAPAEATPAPPSAPAATPAPPVSTPSPTTTQPPNPPPAEEPKPPQVQPAQPQTPPAPPTQVPPPRRPSRPAEPSAAGQPPPAPRLGDILTSEQARQYNAAIDQSLARAQSSLGSIANRQLTKDQQAVVAQIQSFIQQAQTTRKSNLPAARSLAERADVLAGDLAERAK